MKGGLLAFAASLTVFAGTVSHTAARTPAPVSDVAVTEGMPRTLGEYGFFTDLEQQNPTWGVVPYRLNTPLYSDGADKLRFLYVPDGKEIGTDGDGLLEFPVGTAIVKTFAFGEGGDRRLIETRVLLHRADGWLALPYRWNEGQTDATLSLAGARIPVTRTDGSEISYRIPNKNQCKTCHSKDGEVIPIGPKVRNLSPQLLELLASSGHFDAAPTAASPLPSWTGKSGASPADTQQLARAYLDVNCAHCHQPGGGASNSGLDLRWEQDDPHAIGVRKPPVAAGRGSGGHAVSILPGEPDSSILLYRMQSTEPGVAMPELGRDTVDPEGVAVVRAWIEGMPAR